MLKRLVSFSAAVPSRRALALTGAMLVTLAAPAQAQQLAVQAEAVQAPAASVASTWKLEPQRFAAAPADIRGYYAYNGMQPMWVAADGSLNLAARALLKLVESAQVDGVDPAVLNAPALAAAVERADTARTPEALTEAELLLSNTLVTYEQALLRSRDPRMGYEHPNLEPTVRAPQTILEEAAKSASLLDYVAQMQWMHPLYASIREALQAGTNVSNPMALMKNLERVRAIPRSPASRYILVDTASATLWMYENGQPVDSMRVGVGKPDSQTPLYAGYVRYAILNPYWNVPEDLVPHRLAPNVVRQGLSFLKERKYEVISDYGPDAEVLDPSKVDWKAVAKGTAKVKVRQLPTVAYGNAMGKAKFEFPNIYGIYLHDTNEPKLLEKDVRQISSGCIRLQDYKRLGRWLFGGTMPTAESDDFEQQVNLPEPVPIYVTYLTAHPRDGGEVALGADPYGLDREGAGRQALALQTP